MAAMSPADRATGETAARDRDAASTVGWFTALAIAVGVSLVAVLLLMLVPHLVLTRWLSLSRDLRIGLATTWTAAVTVLLLVVAWRASGVGRRP